MEYIIRSQSVDYDLQRHMNGSAYAFLVDVQENQYVILFQPLEIKGNVIHPSHSPLA